MANAATRYAIHRTCPDGGDDIEIGINLITRTCFIYIMLYLYSQQPNENFGICYEEAQYM